VRFEKNPLARIVMGQAGAYSARATALPKRAKSILLTGGASLDTSDSIAATEPFCAPEKLRSSCRAARGFGLKSRLQAQPYLSDIRREAGSLPASLLSVSVSLKRGACRYRQRYRGAPCR